MTTRFALPIERAGIGELHADILFARHGEDAARAPLRALLHEQFIDIFVRFQKFQNGVAPFDLHANSPDNNSSMRA